MSASLRDIANRVVARLPVTTKVPLVRFATRARYLGLRGRSAVVAPTPGHRVDEPAVTIVVTSRNRAELLPIALRSIQKQRFGAFECIIVDEDSTDDALAVAQSFAAVDPRFRIVVHDSPLGLSAARNTGLVAARGRYVCFLDDDDFLLAGSLRSRLDAFRAQPDDVVGTFCDWMTIEPQVGLEAFSPRRAPQRRGTVSLSSLLDGAPFIASSPLLRTDIVRSVGGFDERLKRVEDLDLWFRLARLGFRFVYADCIGVAYRRTQGSLVTAAPGAQLDAILDVFDRADRPDCTVVGHGPMPAPEPLSSIAVSEPRLQQVLRYVALIAADDPDRAVATGRRGLPPIVRRAIDVETQLPTLTSHAATRLALGRDEIRALGDVLRHVLERLVPPIEEHWEPVVDLDSWSQPVVARSRAAGPPPRVAGDIGGAFDGAVILVPEARDHVDELGPIADQLRVRGVDVRFMVSPRTVPATLAELGRYTESVLPYVPAEVVRARALVMLDDWGPLKEAARIANEAGVPTFAKVDGVQDFDDAESSCRREPYRTASYILAQGDNDVAALADERCFIVGSSRLERLWASAPVTPGEHALVNVNFDAHVAGEHRERWVASVRAALRRVGVPGLVSRHPAEGGRVAGLPEAVKPFRHEITKAGLLVSRFSTVPFEAMARGVPFVYHNPHGERLVTFAEPSGAFRVCSSEDDLVEAVAEAISWRASYRHRCASFFSRQIDIDPGRSAAERAADVIVKLTR
jgi:hypothetical protein